MSEGSSRVFVDTNIWVYAHDTSSGDKHERSKSLINELWDRENGCVSVQVLQEFYVAITKKVPHPIDSTSATRIIEDISLWRVHSPRPADVIQAIDLKQRAQISFWDAMILCSARELGCDAIYTEDLNPGQMYDGVRVVDPFSTEQDSA